MPLMSIRDSEPILEGLADAIVASDESGRVVYANQAAVKLFGWSRAELVGMPLAGLMPPRMHALHETGFRRYLETHRPRIFGRPVRVPARRRDGEELDVELTLSSVQEDGKEIIVASLRDLRDRVELERQLLAQQRLAAQNAVMSIFVGAGTVEEAAAGALRAIGEKLGWALGTFWLLRAGRLRWVASWHAPGVEAAEFEALSRQSTFGVGEGLPGHAWQALKPVWIVDMKDEEDFPRARMAVRSGFRAAFAFPFLVRKQVAGVVEFFQRLPQAVEEELLESAATLGGQIGQCVERIEAQVRQREATEAAIAARIEAQTAERRARFLAEAGAALASSLDLEETLRRVAALAVPEIADWCTVAALDDAGALRRVAVTHADPGKSALVAEYEACFPPASHRAGSFFGVLAEGRSILQSVVTDAELRAAAQSDEHLRILRGLGCTSCLMVPMRVRGQAAGVISLMRGAGSPDFEEGDLRMAEELARRAGVAVENARLYRETQEAVQLRDEFLSIASHELRTPLTSLQLQVSGLRRNLAKAPLTPERLAAKVATIDHQVERLGKLVESLLDVSRASAGPLQLEPSEVDLAELVREVVAGFDAALTAAGCRLELVLEEGLAGRWDRMRLAQVITNFISNALKYGPGAPIEVTAFARGDKAVLTVRDHGIGIAAADQRRIFDRFARAVSSEHYSGLGLGLWIVRVLVEAMGGTVAVESKPGQGSTFVVELDRTVGGG